MRQFHHFAQSGSPCSGWGDICLLPVLLQ